MSPHTEHPDPGPGARRVVARGCAVAAVHTPRSGAGFGLIESVVTLAIVSFGLLALAYLQTWGQRHTHDSGARTQATLIAGELMDRIRAGGVAADSADAITYTSAPDNQLECLATSASVDNTRDCFFEQIGERLPGGAGAIAISNRMYLVTIAWPDRHGSRFDDRTACESSGRLWHADANVHWYPAEGKSERATCLAVQRWSLMQ